MIRWLISVALHLAANALALLVADLVLDDLSIEASAFITAVLLFTLVEVLVQPMLTPATLQGAAALRGSVALVATFIGLVVTALINEGFNSDGLWTWIGATVIVWAGGLVAAMILPLIFVKERVGDERAA